VLRTRRVSVAKPKGLSEAEIQKACIQRLRVDGWLVVRFNGGGFEDEKGSFVRNYFIYGINAICGFPDVVAFKGDVLGGRFMMCEFKTAKGELSAAQQRFHDFAAQHKIKVHVIRSPYELDAIWEEEKP
jgi:hypothetical protein